jgi:hypothetical protein
MSPTPRGSGQALAGLSRQSSQRVHRRHGFLCRAHIDVPAPVWFLRVEHGRRRILHFNITSHPTSEWVVQQLREAFPEAGPYRYVILDHDSRFHDDVITFLAAAGLQPKRTSVQAPWHHNDRIHDSLVKDTPTRRPVESEPWPAETVVSSARLGGPHHRYSWRAAA